MLGLIFKWFSLCEFSLFGTPLGQLSGSLGSWSHCSHSKGSGLDLKIIYGGSGIHVLIMLDGTIMLRSLPVWSVFQWSCALMTSARALSSFPSTWERVEQPCGMKGGQEGK